MLLRFLICLLLITTSTIAFSAEDEATADAATESESSSDDEDATDESAPSPVPLPPRASPHVTEQRHASVIQHLELYGRSQEAIQLIAADTPFNGLYLPETMGRPQGGVLLLHDREQHGHWPSITGPLREYLPQYGWATLAIELPTEPGASLPSRGVYQAPQPTEEAAEDETQPTEQEVAEQKPALTTESDDSTGIAASGNAEPQEGDAATELSNGEPPLPRLTGLPAVESAEGEQSPEAEISAETQQQYFQNQMQARIRAAVNYLSSMGQLNLVIIANGSSASWAVDFILQQQRRLLSEEKTLRGNTLVLIDPLQSRYNQLYLEQELKELEIPVLDLITDLNTATVYTNNQRAGLMRHKQRTQYRQIKLSTPNHNNTHQQVKRRIRGWLRSNAAGTELTGAGTR